MYNTIYSALNMLIKYKKHCFKVILNKATCFSPLGNLIVQSDRAPLCRRHAVCLRPYLDLHPAMAMDASRLSSETEHTFLRFFLGLPEKTDYNSKKNHSLGPGNRFPGIAG